MRRPVTRRSIPHPARWGLLLIPAAVGAAHAELTSIVAPEPNTLGTIEWIGDGVADAGFVGWTDRWTDAWDASSSTILGVGSGVGSGFRWSGTTVGNLPIEPGELRRIERGQRLELALPRTHAASIALGVAVDSAGPVVTLSPWDAGLVAVADADGWSFAVRAPAVQGDIDRAGYFEHALIIVRFTTIPGPGWIGLSVCAALGCARRRR